jgi:hypothetical protein
MLWVPIDARDDEHLGMGGTGREDARGRAEGNKKVQGERQYRVKDYQFSFAIMVI